jgi:hypothetical protein
MKYSEYLIVAKGQIISFFAFGAVSGIDKLLVPRLTLKTRQTKTSNDAN